MAKSKKKRKDSYEQFNRFCGQSPFDRLSTTAFFSCRKQTVFDASPQKVTLDMASGNCNCYIVSYYDGSSTLYDAGTDYPVAMVDITHRRILISWIELYSRCNFKIPVLLETGVEAIVPTLVSLEELVSEVSKKEFSHDFRRR